MKKIAFALLTIFSLFVISCEIGLGASVDTDPPSLNISNPPVDAIIRDDFALSGTWTDDGTIGSISVELSRTDGNGEKLSYTGTFAEDSRKGGSGTWSAGIPAKSTSITDGTYQAVVTIKDSTGRTTIQNTTFTIDNSAPLIVLQRPGTKVTETPDAYGQTFSINGMGADENTIDHITVSIYSDEDCTNLLKTITKNNVAPTIELDVAVFEEGVQNDYAVIYGSTSKESEVTRYCKIEAFDNAKRYPAGTERTENDDNGNSTTTYYLYDDIYSGVLENHTVSEVSKMLSGTYLISGQNRSASTVTSVKSILDQNKMVKSNFSLNPDNSPRFTISGKSQLNKDGHDFDNNNNEISNGSEVVIEVSPGLDGISLNFTSLRPYVLPCDASGNATVEDIPNNRIYLTGGSEGRSGTSYKFVVPLTQGLSANNTSVTLNLSSSEQYYIFKVEGTDQRNNKVGTSGKGYGFHFVSNEAAPDLSAIQTSTDGVNWTSDNLVYVKKGSSVYVKGTVSVETGLADLKLYKDKTTNSTPLAEDTENATSHTMYTNAVSGGQSTFVYEIPSSQFEQDTSKQYAIRVEATKGRTSVSTVTIRYDVDGPVIRNYSITPKISTTEAGFAGVLNGSVTVSGLLSDAYSGLNTANATWKVQTTTATVINNSVTWTDSSDTALHGTISNPDEFTISNIDTTRIIPFNSSNPTAYKFMRLVITAYDEVGNSTDFKYVYKVDQSTDIPTVVALGTSLDTSVTSYEALITAIASASTVDDTNIISRGATVTFKITDDDGFKDQTATDSGLTIIRTKNQSTNAATFDAGTTPEVETTYCVISGNPTTPIITYEFPDEIASYKLELRLKDMNAGGSLATSSKNYTFYVQCKGTAPVVTKEVTPTYVTTSTTNVIANPVRNYSVTLTVTEGTGPYTARRVDDNHALTVDTTGTYPVITDTITPPSGATQNGVFHYEVKDTFGQTKEINVEYKLDNTAPEIGISAIPATLTSLGANNASYTFSGTVSDPVPGSGLDKVEVAFDSAFTTSYQAASETSTWNYAAHFSELGLSEGSHTLYARAIDKVGNIMVSTDVCNFIYDVSRPEASIAKYIDIDAVDHELTTANFEYGYKFSLSGRAYDTNDLAATNPVKLIQTKLGNNPDGSEDQVIEITSGCTVSGENWTFGNLPRATGGTAFAAASNASGETRAATGKYRYKVVVKDAVGKETESSIYTVTVDNTAPSVTVNSPSGVVSGENSLTGNSYTFKVTPSDGATGTGTQYIYYKFDSAANYTATAAEDDVQLRLTHTLGTGTTGTEADLYEGQHTLYVYAKDKAGNQTSPVVTKDFYVDQAAPVINENISTDYVKHTDTDNGEVSLGGTINETHGVKTFSVTRGSTVYEIVKNGTVQIAPSGVSWTYTATATGANWTLSDTPGEGSYTYTITATDKAERAAETVTRTVVVDTVSPTVNSTNITLPTGYQTEAALFKFEGSAGCVSDSGASGTAYSSGFENVELAFTTSASAPESAQVTVTPASDGSWSSTVEFGASAFGTVFNNQGNKYLWLKVYDKAGNTSAWTSTQFVYDTEVPSIQLTATTPAANAYKNTGFTIEATAVDSYGIASVVIAKPVALTTAPAGWPANYYTNAECTTAASGTFTANTYYYKYDAATTSTASPITNATYSKAFVTGSSNATAANYLADGAYNFIVTVKDLSGKTASESRLITVDTTDPDGSFVPASYTPAGTAVDENTWYKVNSIRFAIDVDEANIETVEISKDNTSFESMIPSSNNRYFATITDLNDSSVAADSSISANNTIYVKMTDLAGNTKTVNTTAYVDTEALELESKFYRVGTGTVKPVGGTVYSNGTAAITVYGNYKDELTGVNELSFASSISATVTYSTTELSAVTDATATTTSWAAYSTFDDKKTIRSWKAVYTPSAGGNFIVTGTNLAGGTKTPPAAFQVTSDTTLPTFTKPKIEPNTEDFSVYKTTEGEGASAVDVYYLNNKEQTFTISGLASDNTSVDQVYLKIENVNSSGAVKSASRVITDHNASGYFSGIQFKETAGTVWTDGAKVTITVTDIAGNTTEDTDNEIVLNIKFDTQGPQGVHALDSSANGGKDLYFRIGDQNRDEYVLKDPVGDVIYNNAGNATVVTSDAQTTYSGVPAWDPGSDTAVSKDKDVGGKYSGTTYGNAETVKIRGKYVDDGSGINLIYYKIYTTQPNSATTANFLENYKNDNDGYFSLLKTTETRRVFYTGDVTEFEGSTSRTFTPENGGTVTVSGTEAKRYTDITTNYKTTIPNLTAGENYLVFVAVDNVGNAALESVTHNGTTYDNYKLNVDYQAPAIDKDAPAIGLYTNAEQALPITGTVHDNPVGETSVHAGIRSVWLKYDETKSNWIKATVNETTGTWSATVPAATLSSLSETQSSVIFTATATDDAGTGNAASCNITVTIDDQEPTVDISLDTSTYKIGGTNTEGITQVNDTIKIKGSASDINGLKEGETLKLYYTTNAAEKDAVTDISRWTEYTATAIESHNAWTINVTNTDTIFTNNTIYYFTVKATDKAENIGYATPLALEVNKDTDRPVIKLNMTFPANAAAAIVSDNTGIDGTIKDDDGNPAVNKVWCYVSDTDVADVTTITGWKKTGDTGSQISYNATSGSFTIAPGDGTKYVYFKIEDKIGTSFITKAATTYDFNSPIITNKDETVTYGAEAGTATRLQVKTDTENPLTSSFAYLAKGLDETKNATSTDPNGWSSSTGSAVLGGTANNTFRVRLYAYDINGIESVTFKIPMNDDDPDDVQATAVQDSVDTSKSYYEYRLSPKTGTTGLDQNITIGTNTYTLYWIPDTDAIDVTGFASGTRSCIIDTFDGTKHTTETYSFSIDNIPAEATFTSHSNNDQIRASFLLKGGFNDGDNKTSLKYITSLSANEPADTAWASATAVNNVGSNSWTINFDGGATEAQTTHGPLPKHIVANLTDNVIINEAGKAVYENAVTGHAAGDLYTTITTVYFHMLASDGIGNSKWSKIALRIDPQGDIPTITMDYPAIGDEVTTATVTTKAGLHYSKLSGYIRAQGSAEDDKNIVGIYMQIDSDFNMLTGTFDSSWETKDCPGETTGTNPKTKLADFGYTIEDMYTSYNTANNLTSDKTGYKSNGPRGIRVGTSNSWNITLNTSNEFNKSSGNNYIAIKFYAVDEDGNISVWNDEDLVIVCVDSDAPKIGSSEPLYLHQYGFKKNDTGVIYYAKSASPEAGEQLYTTPGCTTAATDITYAAANFTSSISTIEYKKDMWLNGEWWLTGSVEDESGIAEIKIGGMGGNSIKAQCTPVAAGTWANGTSGYRLNYLIGSTDTTNPGYGVLSYNLWVQDDTQEGTKKDTTLAISVQYDNKNPTLAATTDSDYLISENVVNENGFYKVQSVVTEASGESGFDKVIFYFKRGTTVYDSYMPKAVAATNALATSALVSDSDIYWKSNTVTAINGAVITVSADDNIHKGGLVKLGGVIYTITNVNGTSVTLSGNPPSLATGSTMPAYFAIGHVVDHAGTESEGTSKIAATQTNPNPYGLGYYGNSPDDDGDLMLEKVSTGTTKTLWYGLINSRNIPDGAIEIHYVAFDKAGNMAHGQVTNAFVKNNGPRLASLRAWTDYNGNEAGFEDSADLTSAAHKEYESENEVKYYIRRDRKIGGKTVSRATAVTENLIVTGNDKGIEADASAFMRVTDQTQFYPEIVGGNGNLYYSYRIGAGATTEGEYSVNWTTTGNGGTKAFSTRERVEYSDVSADYTTTDEQGESYVNGSALDAITADTTLLGNVGNGNKWFEYTIWDSTGGDKPEWAGGSAGTTTLSAKFTVLLNVAYADTTAPKAVISPFFWKSKSENSLYGNSKDNGHIELENDLAGTVAEELYGSDPKVSGKITIRGTAYDDIRLSQLWVKFEDIDFANALTGTNPDISNRTGYKLAATYDRENGRWNVAGATMESNSWEFTATDRYCNKDGHLVDWELSVDTAKVSGNAVCNKNVYIMAVDQRGTGTNHYSSASASGSKDDGVSVYNKPSYQMDIVPYITEIVTGVRTGGGLKSNNIRSASGKYSILANNSDNTITLKGFNFCTASTMLVAYVASVNPNTSTVSPYGKTLLSNETNVTTTEKTIRKLSIKANSTSEAVITNTGIDKSGYLELFSDGVRALNNINKNDAYGTTTKKISNVDTQISATNAVVTDYENAYNREPDYYTTKNVQLTDDRYFRFFDMKDTGVKNGYYPVMIMNGNNPVFGYVNKSGGTRGTPTATGTDSYAGTYEPSHAMPQRSEFNGSDATKVYTEYLIKASTWDQMGMAVDEGGRYYNVSIYNRDGAAMSLIYDRYAEIETSPQGLGWGAGTGYSNYPAAGSYSNNLENNAITLENVKYGNALLTERFQYPKLITKGNSITGNAIVYMAYYDDGTGEIVCRDFIIGKSLTNTTNTLEKSYTFTFVGDANGNHYFDCSNAGLNGKYVKIDNSYKQLTYSTTYEFYRIADNPIGIPFSSKIYSDNRGTVETEDISSSLSAATGYGQKVNFAENRNNTGAYDTGRLTVSTTGSKDFDMGVTSDNHIVIVYVDSATNKLVLKYSTNAVDGSNPTANIAWTTSSVAFPENIGTYVSIAVDGKAVHIAAFDSFDSNLVYMYLPNYNSATGYKEITVDQASAVGNWTQIKVKDGVPYIAYYNSTENGGRDGIKLAYPVAANGKTAVQNKENPGVDVKPGTAYASSGTGAATGYTTGAWEYMTVPAITPPQGGDPKFQNVCLDFDSDGRPVVGYLGTNLEFGKALDE